MIGFHEIVGIICKVDGTRNMVFSEKNNPDIREENIKNILGTDDEICVMDLISSEKEGESVLCFASNKEMETRDLTRLNKRAMYIGYINTYSPSIGGLRSSGIFGNVLIARKYFPHFHEIEIKNLCSDGQPENDEYLLNMPAEEKEKVDWKL